MSISQKFQELMENDELTIKSKEFLEGYKTAIEDLRLIGDRKRLSYWSHSRELKFAPVELSDCLVTYYNKILEIHRNESN